VSTCRHLAVVFYCFGRGLMGSLIDELQCREAAAREEAADLARRATRPTRSAGTASARADRPSSSRPGILSPIRRPG